MLLALHFPAATTLFPPGLIQNTKSCLHDIQGSPLKSTLGLIDPAEQTAVTHASRFPPMSLALRPLSSFLRLYSSAFLSVLRRQLEGSF